MKKYFQLRSRALAAMAGLHLVATIRLLAQESTELTNAPQKLLPPYAELPPTFWEQHGAFIMIAGMVILIFAALGIWLALKPRPASKVPPAVEARGALKTLRQQPEDGATLSRISQIVRSYFLAAFQLPAGEFTTTEFTRILSTNEEIGAELSQGAAAFLQDCDARKFSAVGGAEPLNAADRAWQLIALAEQRREQRRQLSETQNQERGA